MLRLHTRQAKIVDLNNEKLPFSDEYFDFFSKSVIEHISDVEHYMNEKSAEKGRTVNSAGSGLGDTVFHILSESNPYPPIYKGLSL